MPTLRKDLQEMLKIPFFTFQWLIPACCWKMEVGNWDPQDGDGSCVFCDGGDGCNRSNTINIPMMSVFLTTILAIMFK